MKQMDWYTKPPRSLQELNLCMFNLEYLPVDVFLFKNLTYLNVSFNNLENLPSLTCFLHLRRIECSHNNLKELPRISKNGILQVIKCTNNSLYALPEDIFLFGIREFDCSTNFLERIPEWNHNLQQMTCSNNRIRTFNSLTTNCLRIFDCSYNNKLVALPCPAFFLKELSCGCCDLAELPSLESALKLKKLYCEKNHLKKISWLPLGVIFFTCSGNQIESLPDLSAHYRLIMINCGGNQLRKLPDLPASLLFIDSGNNLLEYLPDFSSSSLLQSVTLDRNRLTNLPKSIFKKELRSLRCRYNQLRAIPDLPEKASFDFYFDENPIINSLLGETRILWASDREWIRCKIAVLNRFRETYYANKYRSLFIGNYKWICRKSALLIATRMKNGEFFHILKWIALFL